MAILWEQSFGVFRLVEVQGHIQRMFLVVYEDKILVLDGGCRGDAGTIREAVKALGRPLAQMRLVAATHAHPDHAGGLDSFRRYTPARLAIPHDMVSWYRGLGGLVQHRVDTLLAAWVAKKQHGRKRRLGFKRIPPYDDLLRDGQTLPGFPDWQVIANPGHTLHDVSFFHAGQGILYAGDLILSIKGQFVPPVPVLFPDLMCASYARVAALPVRWLLMAHGGVVSLENQPSPFGGMCEKMRGHLRSTYPWIRWITQFPAAVRRARSKKEAFR